MERIRKKILTTFLPIIVIIIIAFILIVFLLKFRPKAKEEKKEISLKTVEAILARPEKINIYVNAIGSVNSGRQTMLISEVAGKIIKTSSNFENGEIVKKGEILLELDPTNYQAALANAQSAFADTMLLYQQEKSRAAKAKRDWLQVGRGKKASALTLREPHLESALAKKNAAQSALKKAQNDLIKTKITSPFNARIISAQVEFGSFVAPGTPIATIYEYDNLEIKLPLTENELETIGIQPDINLKKNEQKPKIILNKGKKIWHGEIIRISGNFNPITRVIFATGKIFKPAGLVPGISLRAKIEAKSYPNAFRVPIQAAFGPTTLLILEKTSKETPKIYKIKKRKVKVVSRQKDFLIISAGLQNGETICITPLNFVKDDMKVNILKQ